MIIPLLFAENENFDRDQCAIRLPADIIRPRQFNINRENRNRVYGRFRNAKEASHLIDEMGFDILVAWPFNNYIGNLNRV